MEKKTALYETHVAAGGKMVPFAGYLLPVQYETGVITEHMAVREKAGLFDVSHMGEVLFSGPDALKNLNYILTNSFDSLKIGQVRYSPMCYDAGGVVDDLLVYRTDEEAYLVVVNAANRHKDVEWIRPKLSGDVAFSDISDELSQIALQGPLSQRILEKLASPLPEKYYTFNKECSLAGLRCLISRTGYTGEDGFEIYLANADAAAAWEKIMEAGRGDGLIPCGLGARDTLRLEAGMPLYGHEMDESVDPLQAGLGWAVKMNKDDFVGKRAIAAKGEPKRRRVGVEVTGRGIIREDAEIFAGGAVVGKSTSGTFCPYLGKAVAMAFLDSVYCEADTEVEAVVRGRSVSAKVVPLPFFKREK